MKRYSPIKGLLPSALCAALTLSACATGGSSTSVNDAMKSVKYDCAKPDNAKPTKVTLTSMPIVSNGAFYLGIDRGFFAKHGIEVKVTTVDSVPATVSAVQGGTTDFAFTSSIAAFQALDKKIKLTVVAPFAGIAPGYWAKMQAGETGYTREVTALMVAPSSGIKNPGDLEGKTVAVGDVKGPWDLATRYVITKHGGDPSKVKFVLMPAPDATNALMAGKVDAAYTTDPFLHQAEEKGFEVLSWAGVETFHEGPTSLVISPNNYVSEHPDTTARFACAVKESTAYANGNPDEVREALATAQGVDPATLKTATVPYFYSEIDLPGLERFEKLSEQFDIVAHPVDIKSAIIPQALVAE